MPALSNPQWERFCLEVVAGESLTAAYMRAGFRDNKNVRIAAIRLRNKPEIKTRIEELLGLFAERALLKAEKIQQALMPALEVNAQDFIGPDGKLKPLHQLPREYGAAVKSMRFDKSGRLNEVTLIDKVAAASTLLRSIGAISEGETNLKVSVLAGLGIGVDEENLLERELRAAIEADRAQPVQLDLLAEPMAEAS
jgi:hypothetical protein